MAEVQNTPNTPNPEKVAKKAAKKEKREKRNLALELIKELVDKQSDKKYKEALILVRPSLYGIRPVGGGGGVALYDKFVAFVKEKKNVSEDEVFKNFKIGRKEAAGLIRKHLKTVEKAQRVWIHFDASKGMYNFISTGETAPAYWEGYVPVETKVDLK